MMEEGARLGPYEISGSLGAGGMGEVYRARDTRLDRSVAIKVLPAAISSQPELRARFQREARTISQLNHPHICTLYDVGQEGRTDYLVMELLEGETLAGRLARGPLPPNEVLRYGVEIAEALAVAHRQGITHRDLKPGNVMLTKSGAKLLDFGLAKSARPVIAVSPDSETHHIVTEDRPLTERGTIVGTFQYMAPEQLEGLEADARTDIFALGAVLYEMVTGHKAFEGKTRTSLIASIIDRDPPPIATLQPMPPAGLERVIRGCLAKDRDERWQSAHDVALQLRALTSSAGEASAGRAPRRRREAAAWLLAAVFAVAALSLLALRSRTQPSWPVYGSVAAPDGTQLVFGGPAAGALTVSPDGRYMTFAASDSSSVNRIWVRRLDTGEARALVGTEGAEYPFWSPDSRQLGFFRARKLQTVSIEGGPAVTVCDVNEPRGGSWSKDGVIIFTPHWRDAIHRVPATGGKPVPITKIDRSRNETTHRWPVFLPDGKHFLYLAGSHTAETTSGDNAVYVASTAGGAPRLLLRARSNVAYAAGRLLFLREQKLVAQRFDASSLELTGEPVVLADGVRYERGFFQGVFAASDTILLYQGGGSESKSRLDWVDRKGDRISTLIEAEVFFDVSVAPNGKLAVTSVGDPADLWLFDLERGSRTRLTFDPWQESSARWSPDSSTLLYWTDRHVQADILRKSLGPAAETVFLGDPAVHEKPLDWSRDGRFIAVSRAALANAGASDIWIYPASGPAQPFAFTATSFDEFDGRFSPDGRALAFVSNESGRYEVYVAQFPGGEAKVLISTDGGYTPRWRADGREIFYVAANGTMTAVPVDSTTPLVLGTATPLFRAPFVFAPDPFYDVAADGQRFLVNQREKAVEDPLTLVMNWTEVVKEK